MIYPNIGQTFANLANNIISALGRLINGIVSFISQNSGIVSFISQNADMFGTILGVGVLISAILSLTGRDTFPVQFTW